MGRIAIELLIKKHLRFGGLFRAVLLICVLHAPAMSFGQSAIHPEFYGLRPALTVSSEIRSVKPNDLLKSPRKQAVIDKATLVFQPLAGQIRSLANTHKFSDWMRIQLTMKTAKMLYRNPAEQTLAAVGLMRAMGLKAALLEFRDNRSGKQGDYAAAVAIKQQIFGGVMFEHENSLFVILDLQKEAAMKSLNGSTTIVSGTESESASQNLRPIDLELSAAPNLPMQPQKTALRWSYKHDSYSLPVTVNANLIRYYKTYPQLDIKVYLNRPVNPNVIGLVVEPLKEIIVKKNFSEKDAVEFLLSFCHQAFNHMDDKKNLGYEHQNFIEETVVAKASDCEDFVLLLSVLIRGALGYPVIGLEYPNHLSLAVALPKGELKGEGYRYNGKTYVHCDPSFVGGSLGDVQPDFKDMNPKLIPIGNIFIYDN